MTLALLAHAPPHAWYPALHEIPQLVPSHVATALGGVAHEVHELPQVAVLEFGAHVAPHAW